MTKKMVYAQSQILSVLGEVWADETSDYQVTEILNPTPRRTGSSSSSQGATMVFS
jgi:hypothetical protein